MLQQGVEVQFSEKVKPAQLTAAGVSTRVSQSSHIMEKNIHRGQNYFTIRL